MAAIVGVVCDQGGAAAVRGVRDESFAAIGVPRYPPTAVARLACCSGAPGTYAGARYEHGESLLALVGASPARGKDAPRHTVGRPQPVQRAVAAGTGFAGSPRLTADGRHATADAALRHAHEHVAVVRVGSLHQGRVGHGHVRDGRRADAGHDDRPAAPAAGRLRDREGPLALACTRPRTHHIIDAAARQGRHATHRIGSLDNPVAVRCERGARGGR